MHTSARESEKAGAVIEKLISKNCCEPVDRCYLMSELLKIAQLSTPGTGMNAQALQNFKFKKNIFIVVMGYSETSAKIYNEIN